MLQNCHNLKEKIWTQCPCYLPVNTDASLSHTHHLDCKQNPIVWSFEWNLYNTTFTWFYVYLQYCINLKMELLSLWMKSYSVSIQMKSFQQYLHTIPSINFVVFSKETKDQYIGNLWSFRIERVKRTRFKKERALLPLGRFVLFKSNNK